MPPGRAGSAGRRRVARGPSGRPLAEGQQSAYGPPRAALHQRGAAAGGRPVLWARPVAASGGRDAARRDPRTNTAPRWRCASRSSAAAGLRNRTQAKSAPRAQGRRPGPPRLSGASPNGQRPSGPIPKRRWGDQLVPTEATALSSVRPLFLFPEAIQLYDRVVIRAGAGTDCFPAYGLGGHGGQCPPRSRARRRSARWSSGCCAATRACSMPRAPASSCRVATGTTSPGRHHPLRHGGALLPRRRRLELPQFRRPALPENCRARSARRDGPSTASSPRPWRRGRRAPRDLPAVPRQRGRSGARV